MPDICVASSRPTNTIQLVLRSKLHKIERVAIDVRFTSEIVLANIILLEKYRNQPPHSKLQFIPMVPDLDTMLAACDAAVIVQDVPLPLSRTAAFTLDLVEEWTDLTGLPYIHGFWVGREEELSALEAQALLTAKNEGVSLKTNIAQSVAQQQNRSVQEMTEYLSSFTYDFGEQEQESLAEFIHYAYFHGMIGDVPDIHLFDFRSSPPQQN